MRKGAGGGKSIAVSVGSRSDAMEAAAGLTEEDVGCGVPRPLLIDALRFSFFVRGRWPNRRVAAFPHDAAKSRHQFRSGRTQLVAMMKREFAENLLALGSERQQHLPAILLRAGAMDKSARLQTGHYFE